MIHPLLTIGEMNLVLSLTFTTVYLYPPTHEPHIVSTHGQFPYSLSPSVH